MKKISLLFIAACFIPMMLFSQSTDFVEPGRTFSISQYANRSYVVAGTLTLEPPFDFKGSSGNFFASAIMNPVNSWQVTGSWNYNHTIFTGYWDNINAFLYVITLIGPNGTQTFTKTDGGTPANYYEFDGLQQNAIYQFYVQAWGGTPTVSQSNVITFSSHVAVTANPAKNITSTTAIASWNSWPGATSYTVQIFGPGFPYTTYTTSNTNFTFQGLHPSSTYSYSVNGNAPNQVVSNVISFTTCSASAIFLAPTNLAVHQGTSAGNLVSANITWDQVVGASSYNLLVKDTNGNVIDNIEVALPNYNYFCSCGTQYIFSVSAKAATCSDYVNYASSTIANVCTLSTGRYAASIDESTKKDSDSQPAIDEPTVNVITVYPNPASDIVTIAVPSKATVDAPILFFDMLGNISATHNLKKGEWKREISTNNLPEGVYIVKVFNEGRINSTKIVVVHK